MVILVDTREQKMLAFTLDTMLTGLEFVALPVGDYACRFRDGTQPPLVFERKSIPDLFGTMTGGYLRFKREMVKARQLGLTLVLIIEGTLTEVLAGTRHSSAAGASIVQKLFTLQVRYGLQPVFCDGRQEMSRYIVETYAAIGRNYVQAKEASHG